jgi:hypothetical protein
MCDVHNTIQDFKKEIHSIARNDREYITILASQIDNDYHLFLSSCLDADDDISKVDWNYIDQLSDKIKESVKSRSKPNFVMTSMVRAIAEQSRVEVKRKQEADALAGKTGFTPPRKKRQEKGKRVRFYDGGDDNSDDNSSDGRESDPRQVNPKLNPKWKMSNKEFKRVISPNTSKCPKLGEKSICAMYNIVGRCYFGSRCHHSHDELTGTVRNEFEKWIVESKKMAKEHNKKEKKDD